MTADPAPAAGVATRRMVELGREEALRLLASVPLGRVGFTQQALPAIRPVNHLVHDGEVVIRTHTGSALLKHSLTAEVVAYEADEIDPDTHTGWSVVVTGLATRVTDPDDLARYQGLLHPWVGTEMAHVVRIVPELVSGYRLEAGPS
ncbi:pyridoxamine 5'-phosphate oxidase family protein [Streptomyces sp. NPDC005526]|uniref:pyridoxamine 5'-phosphate oxidase family protein n=1 Tax=Streptomyces sp. NPDC005526 TaxID=3156885 RepID=UPI00339F1B65